MRSTSPDLLLDVPELFSKTTFQVYEVVESGFRKKFWDDQKQVGAGRPHRLWYRLALLFLPESVYSRRTAPKTALGVPQGLGAGGSWPNG